MSKAFIKLNNIPSASSDVTLDEVYVPVHEIHSLIRVGRDLHIVFCAASGGPMNVGYTYTLVDNEAAIKAVADILDAMAQI